MFSVEADGSKRLVVISVAGHVSAKEVKHGLEQVRQTLTSIAPGFRALTDFRWLDSMESSAFRDIAKIMDAFAEKQIGSVVRVVPDPHKDIGLNILSLFHYGPEIHIATFQTLADALQSLAEAKLGDKS